MAHSGYSQFFCSSIGKESPDFAYRSGCLVHIRGYSTRPGDRADYMSRSPLETPGLLDMAEQRLTTTVNGKKNVKNVNIMFLNQYY